MARSYSEKFLQTLTSADPDQLGVQLGHLCIHANIPTIFVAKLLGTTRMTVYSWFRGADIRRKYKSSVRALVDLLREDYANGVLPDSTKCNRILAKEYMETLAGRKL